LESNTGLDFIYIGKLVLTIVFLTLSIFGLYITFNCRRWYIDLLRLEQNAHYLRDDAMFNLTSYRSQLAKVKQSITQAEAKMTMSGPVISNKLVMDSAVAALKMFIRKEKSILQWGALGVKLAKSAFDYFTKGR
jgi:hypothetical protein